MEGYKKAATERRAELREEVENPGRRQTPTVLQFAGAKIDNKTGRVTMTWPG